MREPQGFPILIDGTLTSKNEIQGLVVLSVKIAHLSRDITTPNAIHEAQDRTIELSEETGGRAGTWLTGIFSQCHITTPRQPIFNRPMIPHQS